MKIQSMLQTIDEETTLRISLLDKRELVGNCDVYKPFGDKPVLMNLFVAEYFRGKGWGTRLMEEAEHAVRIANGRKIYLWVMPDNPSIELYMHRNYARTGEYTDNGGIWMIKAIR